MIKNLITYGFGESFARGINWLILAILPLFTTSPEEYGMVGLIVALEGIATSIFIAGQDRSVLRFYFHEKHRAPFLFTVYALCLLIVAPLFIGVVGARVTVVYLAGIPVFPHLFLLVGAILFLNLNKVYLAVLRVEENPNEYIKVRIGFAVLKLAFVLIIIQKATGSLAYVSSVLIAAGAVFVITLPGVKKRIAFRFDRAQAKRLWVFGWPFMFHVMGGNLLAFADRFMLEWYLDLAAVGTYTLAYTLGSAVVFIYGSMAIYFEPLIYKKAGETEVAEKIMALYAMACILFGALWGLGILVALPYLVANVWGEEYIALLSIAPIILAAHLLMPVYLQANYRLTLHEKTRVLATGTVIAAISNILLNIVLIPHSGVAGAATATYISLFILGVIVLVASVQFTGVTWKEIRSLPVLFCTLGATLTMVIVPMDVLNIPVFIFLALITGGVLYLSKPQFATYLKRT